MMAQLEKVDYSTLEVDERGQNLPEVKPETDLPEVKPGTDPPEVWRPNTDLPEAFDQTGKEVAPPAYAGRRRAWNRILPPRRKAFWSLLAAAILLTTGAAVGAGFGATRKRSAASPAAADTTRGILPTTSLAAANYTDAHGVPHSQLYYQAPSLQILMASRADTAPPSAPWTVAPVAPADSAIAPRNATPIAAYNWRWDDGSGTSDFRCLFVDGGSSAAVRALWAPDRGASGWRAAGVLDGILTAAAGSQLVEHAVQCPGCDRSDFTGYQAAGPAGELLLYYPFGNGIRGDSLDKQVLITGKDSGVGMAYFNGTAWYHVDSVAGMEDVLPLSPIAATQTGHVFALEGGPQIVEWNLVEGAIPTFERVGIVNGTGS
ncbi:putative fungal fucose-specific lectin protein [Neofusicoccum parvum UCRNP2]|uniref:Putative fungal fucose-specific lectin protein n=1 Tax=Botryosphaeria parva (strain UCR-NP2) TaxID=1287680 RepID=R1EMC4_BOTPV|nr:putative fungal fucose-specific lectin protein [Neofusicoccum parvum UCRNP2]